MRPRARFRLGRDEVRAGAPGGASAADLDEVIPRIRGVAKRHAPDGGYGDTAYNSGDGTVYWVPADWTSNDELDAAHADFLDIDGVNAVVGDAESALPGGGGWQHVWPVPGSEEAYERVLALAERPLQIEDAYVGFAAGTVPASAHYRPASVANQNCGTCSAYAVGHCTMFTGDPPVQTDMVCDKWDAK